MVKLKDNRGMSLVELIAVMAIMVILSSAVIGFMVAGVRQYQEARSEVSRQTEVQLVSNQLQELLIDTANGVRYDDARRELWAYTTETENGSTVYTATKISWNTTENQLLFSKYTYDPQVGGGYNEIENSIDQLLAENVSDFSADMSELNDKNIITFAIEITVRGKSYDTESTLNLRNKLKEVTDEEEAFQESVVELSPTVKNVVISPGSVCIWQGSSYSGFNAVINGINFPSQEVVWSFNSVPTDAGTTIDPGSGMVTLGKDETARSLMVVATSVESKKDEPDSSKWVSGTATILNKYITGIQAGSLESMGSMTAQADIFVNGVNFEGNEELANFITFEVRDESGKTVNDIATSVKSAGEQSAGERLDYVLKLYAPEKYKDKKISVTPMITYNEKTYRGNEVSVIFKEPDISGITLQMQQEDGEWMDCSNTLYNGKRGEVLSFRVKVSYRDENGSSFDVYWTPEDSEWTEQLEWSIQRGGKVTQAYGDVSEILNNGTFTIGDLTRFPAANSYSFSVNLDFKGNASVNGQSMNISIPEVSLSIQERHEDQSREFMTNGESQNIHFVVAGLAPELYDVVLEPVENSVMQQTNVRISGDLAILSPQKAGAGDMKFNLVDKSGAVLNKGNKALTVSLPLEVGNKNLYVRTGSFGSYGYTLVENSMFVPVKNYSKKSNVVYSINGVKAEYRTSTGLFGTTRTVKLNDGSITYTQTTHDGEEIWYR